jgi:hypothetical protein
MPASDFYEFMLYEQLEPFGDRRGDVQAGVIAATIANVNRSKSTDRYFKPTDFIPDWEPKPVVQQTPEQIFNIMKIIQKRQNAIVEARRG